MFARFPPWLVMAATTLMLMRGAWAGGVIIDHHDPFNQQPGQGSGGTAAGTGTNPTEPGDTTGQQIYLWAAMVMQTYGQDQEVLDAGEALTGPESLEQSGDYSDTVEVTGGCQAFPSVLWTGLLPLLLLRRRR